MVVDSGKIRGCLIAAALIAMVPPAGARAGVIQDVRASAEEIAIGEKLEIRFRLSEPAATTVSIYDSDMRVVRAYDLGQLQPGEHGLQWDATDLDGRPVPPEAYVWRIEAKTRAGIRTWEPTELCTRVMEEIPDHQWNPPTRVISYRLSVPMRMWVRTGIHMGACLRVLVEGEPRPRGVIVESWDAMDETGTIQVNEQPGWGVAVYGYRLPQPCVIVTGGSAESASHPAMAPVVRLRPAIALGDAPWHRRRTFTLLDRLRPELLVDQLDKGTFVAYLNVPSTLRPDARQMLQNTLAHRVRLKWFIDGHCAAEDVDAVIPSMLTLQPGQIPADGKHFITANLLTALDSIFVASRWIE